MDRIIKHNSFADRLGLLWIGLGIYCIGYAQTDYVMLGMIGNLLNHIMPIGTLLIFLSLFTSLRPSEIQRTRTAWILIGCLLFWHIFMVFRYDPEDMLAPIVYADPYSYTVYLFALVLLIPPVPLVQSYFRISRWLILIGIPLMLIPLFLYATHGALQFCFEGYLAAGGLILMTSKYHKKELLWLAFAGLFVAFLIATIKARRNLMATTMLYLLGGAYMMIFRGKKMNRSTQILLIMSGISCALIAAAVFMLNQHGIFSTISERAGDNTRDYVFLLFFWDMLKTPLDIIIGRGIRGGHECIGVDESGDGIRYAVENGYLQMMLKGGVIYILLILATHITAIKKAWSSKNQLCQASVIIIAVQLFDMLPFGLHAASAKTFIIWMCVSICLCPALCNKSDEELMKELTEKQLKLPKWE